MSADITVARWPLRRGPWRRMWLIADTLLYLYPSRTGWYVNARAEFCLGDERRAIVDWMTRNRLLNDIHHPEFPTRRDAHQAVVAALETDPPPDAIVPPVVQLIRDSPGRYRHPDSGARIDRLSCWRITLQVDANTFTAEATTLREAQLLLRQWTS